MKKRRCMMPCWLWRPKILNLTIITMLYSRGFITDYCARGGQVRATARDLGCSNELGNKNLEEGMMRRGGCRWSRALNIFLPPISAQSSDAVTRKPQQATPPRPPSLSKDDKDDEDSDNDLNKSQALPRAKQTQILSHEPGSQLPPIAAGELSVDDPGDASTTKQWDKQHEQQH